MNPCALVAAAARVISASLPSPAQTSADVVDYGSTPGGYCAAIAAAREGASVILGEHPHRYSPASGGQMNKFVKNS